MYATLLNISVRALEHGNMLHIVYIFLSATCDCRYNRYNLYRTKLWFIQINSEAAYQAPKWFLHNLLLLVMLFFFLLSFVLSHIKCFLATVSLFKKNTIFLFVFWNGSIQSGKRKMKFAHPFDSQLAMNDRVRQLNKHNKRKLKNQNVCQICHANDESKSYVKGSPNNLLS